MRTWNKFGWPTGSKERFLEKDYPGCSSILDAFKVAVKNNHQPNLTCFAGSTSTSPEISQIFKLAMREIEEAHEGKLLDEEISQRLALMPVTDELEINAWKEAYLKALTLVYW